MSQKKRIRPESDFLNDRLSTTGSRMVSVILDRLAVGASLETMTEDYHIKAADVQAALIYAGQLARDRVIALPVEAE